MVFFSSSMPNKVPGILSKWMMMVSMDLGGLKSCWQVVQLYLQPLGIATIITFDKNTIGGYCS